MSWGAVSVGPRPVRRPSEVAIEHRHGSDDFLIPYTAVQELVQRQHTVPVQIHFLKRNNKDDLVTF